jgi:hypothetical protein
MVGAEPVTTTASTTSERAKWGEVVKADRVKLE